MLSSDSDTAPERTKPSYSGTRLALSPTGRGRYSKTLCISLPGPLCKWCKKWVLTVPIEANDFESEFSDGYEGSVFTLL